MPHQQPGQVAEINNSVRISMGNNSRDIQLVESNNSPERNDLAQKKVFETALNMTPDSLTELSPE